MKIFNFKIKPRVPILAAAVLSAALFFAAGLPALSNNLSSGVATADGAGEYSLAAGTEEQREALLRALGHEPSGEISSDIVIIPESFNDAYSRYNELQKRIGLDLSPYGGREAQRYVYGISDGKRGTAVLLVRDGRLIGGHVTSGIFGEDNRSLNE